MAGTPPAPPDLLVVAAPGSGTVETDGGYVLRLASPPELGDASPPGLFDAARQAAAQLHRAFPDWLWRWIQESGALNLATYQGPISWWWYSPLSEMSPIRSPFIRELFWLLLVRQIVRQHTIRRLVWIGGDFELARAAELLATSEGVTFQARVQRQPLFRFGGVLRQIARRIRVFAAHVFRRAALRATGFGRIDPAPSDVLLYSRFPVLWEGRGDGWVERMFGEWPDFLTAKGHCPLSAVVVTLSAREIMTRRRDLRAACLRQRILAIETLTSLRAAVTAFFDVRFVLNYLRWRRNCRAALFEGLDVSALLRRELDTDVAGFEIASNKLLEAALSRLMDRMPSLRAAFFPFEYQPMERAVSVAATRHRVASIGLQTGLFTSNQMGFLFPKAEVRLESRDATRAPLPDALSAYGELPWRVFRDRLGDSRVALVGPIRYARLGRPPRLAREAFLAQENLPLNSTILLVTTSTIRIESLSILEAAFQSSSAHPAIFLALKFHYHLPLHRDAARIAAKFPSVRWRVFDSQLDELMSAAMAIICGGSSTGIEAIARGCMPLVFNLAADLLPNPMLDAAGGAFFWQTPNELDRALTAVLENNATCADRRAHWPEVMREQLSPLTPDMNERLYSYLRERSILAPPA